MKYAALIEDSYHIPGDERSRTNPGHGYPAHDVNYTKFQPFDNEQKMTEWVQSQESSAFTRSKYKIIRYQEMKVSSTVKVEVQINKE